MTARLAAAAGVVALLTAAAPAAGATRACRATVARGVLPAWARTGFSDPRPRMPHVTGRRHLITAILFGDPLQSPPSPRLANKILWAPRTTPRSGSDLRISAQRMRGTRDVGRHVIRVIRGGPGPSYVNLPAAGCWRLTLSWARRLDTLDLRYR
jgi:hypothetical protein